MIEIVEELVDVVIDEARIIDQLFLLLLQHVPTEDGEMREIIDRLGEIQHEISQIYHNRCQQSPEIKERYLDF